MSISSRDHSLSKHRARRVLALLGATLAALVLVATQAFAFEGVDYIVPTANDVATERVEALMSTEAAPDPDLGERVSYLSFDGTIYPLTRYTGAYVQLLLPDSWIGAGGLSDSQRRLLIDRADFFYAHAKEVVGREPLGSGKLPIAIVPVTCAASCGFVGAKGIEVDQDYDPFVLSYFRSSGELPQVLGHELAHNFDVFHDHLFVPGTGPGADAWAGFLHAYLNSYTRMGSSWRSGGIQPRSPEQVIADALRDTYEPYYEDPAATWQRCVADAQCTVQMGSVVVGPSPDNVWSGVTHRFAQLHGAAVVKRFLGEIASFAATSPLPVTLQDAADLHTQAMGRALERNIECYADTWRWSLSSAARTDLRRFAPAEACSDVDGDAYSRLQGDCDDANRFRNPGVLSDDITGAVDDDCDGLVDEGVALSESEGADFADDTWVNYPGQVSGVAGIVSGTGDADSFTFDVTAPGLLDFELCSDRSHMLQLWEPSGYFVGAWNTPIGGCLRKTYSPVTAPATGRWRIKLLGLGGLRYELEVRPGVAWPAPSWGGLTVNSTVTACRYNAVTSTTALPGGVPAPNRARLWATGLGFVGSAVYRGEASIPWIPSQGGGSYELRAQLQSANEPVSDWSTATSFPFVPPAGGCGPCDDGIDNDGDGLIDAGADPGCKDITSTSEAPACDDGIDNDADGTIDWDGGPSGGPADTYCGGLGYNGAEKPTPRCGIIGIEPVALLLLRGALRRMRRERAARRAHSSPNVE